MKGYIKRLMIAIIMTLCVSQLFVDAYETQAAKQNVSDVTLDWIWPSNGMITDTYGTRSGHHKGIDIAGGINSPIHSVDKGIVVKSYFSQTYGHVIFIKHPNNLETVYAHLNERLVSEGKAVKQGEVIGKMGNTGQSSGVHLHLEVHQTKWTYEKENAIDPMIVLGAVDQGTVVQALAKRQSLQVVGAMSQLKPDANNKQGKTIEVHVNKNLLSEKRHTVQAGETLWSISQIYEISVENLKTANQLKEETIFPKQKLIITHSRKE